MPIITSCICGKRYRADLKHAGRKANCPNCGRRVIIGDSGSDQSYGITAPSQSSSRLNQVNSSMNALPTNQNQVRWIILGSITGIIALLALVLFLLPNRGADNSTAVGPDLVDAATNRDDPDATASTSTLTQIVKQSSEVDPVPKPNGERTTGVTPPPTPTPTSVTPGRKLILPKPKYPKTQMFHGNVVIGGKTRNACFGTGIDPQTGGHTEDITLRGYVNGEGWPVVRNSDGKFIEVKFIDRQPKLASSNVQLQQAQATDGFYYGAVQYEGAEWQQAINRNIADEVSLFFGMTKPVGSGEITINGKSRPAYFSSSLEPSTGEANGPVQLNSYINGSGQLVARNQAGVFSVVNARQLKIKVSGIRFADNSIGEGWYYSNPTIKGAGIHSEFDKHLAGLSLLFFGIIQPEGVGMVALNGTERHAVFGPDNDAISGQLLLRSYRTEKGKMVSVDPKSDSGQATLAKQPSNAIDKQPVEEQPPAFTKLSDAPINYGALKAWNTVEKPIEIQFDVGLRRVGTIHLDTEAKPTHNILTYRSIATLGAATAEVVLKVTCEPNSLQVGQIVYDRKQSSTNYNLNTLEVRDGKAFVTRESHGKKTSEQINWPTDTVTESTLYRLVTILPRKKGLRVNIGRLFNDSDMRFEKDASTLICKGKTTFDFQNRERVGYKFDVHHSKSDKVIRMFYLDETGVLVDWKFSH